MRKREIWGGVLALAAMGIGVWMVAQGTRLRSAPTETFRAIGALPRR